MRILINNCLVLSREPREEIGRRQPVTSQPAPGPQLCRETSLMRVWCYTLLMHFNLFKAPSFFPWEVFSHVMLGCSYCPGVFRKSRSEPTCVRGEVPLLWVGVGWGWCWAVSRALQCPPAACPRLVQCEACQVQHCLHSQIYTRLP